MTEQKREYIHFESCINIMNNTLDLLEKIHDQPPDNKLILPAFRFALIEYCKPYNASYSEKDSKNKKKSSLKLEKSHIPETHIKLHEQIMDYRNELLAHFDLTTMDAELHIHNDNGEKYTQTAQNIIYPPITPKDTPRIIKLIEATLENMNEHKKTLLTALV